MNVRSDSARTPPGVTPYPARPYPGQEHLHLLSYRPLYHEHVEPKTMKPPPPIPKPATHPTTCRTCEGTGWQEGPPIVSHAAGQPVTYTTVIPCRDMGWYNQNQGWDPYYDEPAPRR